MALLRSRLVALLLLGGCAATPPAPTRPEGLPGALQFQGPLEALTPDWQFVLREGRLWARSTHGDKRDLPEGWSPVLDSGLPHGGWGYPVPQRLTRMTADGSYLVAEGDDGTFHVLRWRTFGLTGFGQLMGSRAEDFTWAHAWGFPIGPTDGPLKVNLTPPPVGLAMSDRTKFNVGFHADLNGHPHWFDFGCDTLFALHPDGSVIDFADPWLPDHFGGLKRITTPLQGRVRGVALSAAASSLMLLADDGSVWTRTFDFDLAGEDFYFFAYTWADADSATLRVRLPLPDWTRQPPLPGTPTQRITVVTMPGRVGPFARELRVEGRDAEGHTGLFTKPISPFETWQFTPTESPLQGAPVAALPPGPLEAERYDLSGESTLALPDGSAIRLRISSWNRQAWQPAFVELRRGEESPLRVLMHTHELRTLGTDGTRLRGAFVAPPGKESDPRFVALAGGRSWARFRVELEQGVATFESEDAPRWGLRLPLPPGARSAP